MRRFRFEQQQGQQQHSSASFHLHAECRHSQGQPFGWRIASNRLFRDHRQRRLRQHGSGRCNGGARRRYRLTRLHLRCSYRDCICLNHGVFLCRAGNLYPDFHRNRFYTADAKRGGFIDHRGCCRTTATPQSPSYSLSITGPSQLAQGGTATATLTATYVGGFDSPVSVAPVFLPTGISITSGPIVFTAANLSQTVTFAASSSTVLATYPTVFTGTGGDLPAQTVSFSLTVVAPPPLPSGYVYITTPAGINAYASPGQGAALSLIPGSPFQVTGTVIGSAGVPPYTTPGPSPQYLVSYDATNIYTYSIGSNGAIGPQVSTLSTQAYSGNVCGAPINAVTSGQLVYVGLGSTTTPSCYANQTFNVSNTGLLTFLGSTRRLPNTWATFGPVPRTWIYVVDHFPLIATCHSRDRRYLRRCLSFCEIGIVSPDRRPTALRDELYGLRPVTVFP
jgi:hypothetical protein